MTLIHPLAIKPAFTCLRLRINHGGLQANARTPRPEHRADNVQCAPGLYLAQTCFCMLTPSFPSSSLHRLNVWTSKGFNAWSLLCNIQQLDISYSRMCLKHH